MLGRTRWDSGKGRVAGRLRQPRKRRRDKGSGKDPARRVVPIKLKLPERFDHALGCAAGAALLLRAAVALIFADRGRGLGVVWRSSAAACQHRVETQMHAGVQSLLSGRTSKPSFSDSVAVGGKVMRYLSLTPPPPKLLLS